MATNTDRAQEIQKLHELIKNIDYGMFTTVDDDGSLHSYPMSKSGEINPEATLWFFTYAASHKVTEIEHHEQVNVSFSSSEQQRYGEHPSFLQRGRKSVRISKTSVFNLPMTPEKKQALQEHIQAIAKILYEDTSPERLTNLAGIEEAVRSQMQKHVMPEIGVFLSKRLRAQEQGIKDD